MSDFIQSITSDPEFHRRRTDARNRISEFDRADGFADRDLAVILTALAAGLARPNTEVGSDLLFDALVMLEDVVEGASRLTQRPQR